jgi:hypothetical protein
MKMILKKLKAMNYKRIISIALIVFSFSILSAQIESETRSYIKTVPVGKETTLEVYNKYGTIQITPWNKDSVYIKAEVKAYGPNKEKLSKMFDGIAVTITESKYIVRAQTEFTQNMNTLFEHFKGMTSKMISYDSKVEIDYFISIPEYLNLKVENKYGDLYIETISGKLEASVSNGSFKANSINKSCILSLAFCDANINYISSGKINSSFAEITIGRTDELDLFSTSSRIDIKEAGVVSFESRRDKFFFNNTGKLIGKSYFTDFRLDSLKSEININAMYGNVNVEMIDKGFESVSITSAYTDISLEIDPASSYEFDIRHINTFIVLPDKNAKIEKKVLNEEKKEYITYGSVGKNPGSSKIKIDASRGKFYLK